MAGLALSWRYREGDGEVIEWTDDPSAIPDRLLLDRARLDQAVRREASLAESARENGGDANNGSLTLVGALLTNDGGETLEDLTRFLA